ncbi:hypothetical protein A2U01_0019607 [Trifolium medium]|uniref:Uncharacterized protein n=1 Tax=Trifolium medium TaxID=97028 RepID=A0A392NFR7_9FABA|nr:hypothetical protein [Trifolium medium]
MEEKECKQTARCRKWRINDGPGTAARINGGDEASMSKAGALVFCA